jgi:hypothetical protein
LPLLVAHPVGTVWDTWDTWDRRDLLHF